MSVSAHMANSPNSIEWLLRLMDERDRRYADNRTCDQDAVKLAKEIADKAKGTVNIVALVAVASLVLHFVSLFK